MAQLLIKSTDDLSKADEIALLDKLVANLPSNSYLRFFLSDEAVSWLKQQIRDDFGCDLMGNFKDAQAVIEDREHQLTNLRKDLQACREDLHDEIEHSEERKAEMKRLQDSLSQYQHEDADRQEELGRVKLELAEYKAEAIETVEGLTAKIEEDNEAIASMRVANERAVVVADELRAVIETKDAELGIQDYEIVRLKAEIYDLEHPATK